ncbi:MAG TPA: trypsin-like peptidase domain-containing protein [Micromonosporaceae bacterium]|nr:trypsin-like peptidase domain-containing protein [Micromonosporaceae bacterium]
MSEHESNIPRQEAAHDIGPVPPPQEPSHVDPGPSGSAAPPPPTSADPAHGAGASAVAGHPGPAATAGQAYPHPTPPDWSSAGPAHPPHSGPYPAPGPTPGQYLGAPPPYGWTPYPMAGPAPRRPGRFGKYVAAGAAALVLMAGSGVAGGIVALAFNQGSGPTYTAAPIINPADLPAIAASVQDSVVSISAGAGEGSGVVLSADGFILTNNHVVDEAGRNVEVVFANGRTASAKVIGTDPRSDLAVIKADRVSDLAAATFGDSDAIRVGDTVLALGSPLGLQGSVTAGIISAKNRTIRAGGDDPGRRAVSISGLLQTDAPINPGNSGGALVNTRGEVIGINTAIATAGQGNTGNIGVGFAIPSNKAKAIAEILKEGGKVSHPHLGVEISTAEGGGALVGRVVPGSPADRIGLRKGDVVTRFGDKVIENAEDLTTAVQARKAGDQVELTYKRNGVEEKATVTLAEAS